MTSQTAQHTKEALGGCCSSRANEPVILFIGSEQCEQSLRRITPNTYTIVAADARVAARLIDRYRPFAILVEAETPSGSSWRHLLSCPKRISFALIVVTRNVDPLLWAEVLNLGGFDLLIEPFRADEVRFVLSAAFARYGYCR